MSAFDECSAYEKTVRSLYFEPLFGAVAQDGRYVLTNKGRLSRNLQMSVGDALVNRRGDGAVVAVECKAERRHTGNLFLEEWSNRSIGRKGWIHTLESDVLLYFFGDRLVVYCLSLPQLQGWAIPVWSKYPLVRQSKYEQSNDTWGRLVPILDIADAVPMWEFDVAPNSSYESVRVTRPPVMETAISKGRCGSCGRWIDDTPARKCKCPSGAVPRKTQESMFQ